MRLPLPSPSRYPVQGHGHPDLDGQLANSYGGIADPKCIGDLRVLGYGARVVGDAVYQQHYVRLDVRRTKCTAKSVAQPMVQAAGHRAYGSPGTADAIERVGARRCPNSTVLNSR